MPRENIETKGRRLLAEGRLRIEHVGEPSEWFPITAECRGDSGEVYSLGWDQSQLEWRCTCPAKGRCSHLVALQLVTVKPPPPQGGELPSVKPKIVRVPHRG